MKKLLCITLAILSIVSLAACSKEPENNIVVETKAPSVYSWPDTALFKDVPAVSGTIGFYRENQNDKGYTYAFGSDGVDYKGFCAYIAELEKAGFEFYDVTGLDITDTEDVLPEELEEGTYNASWLGKRRGLYISAQWYGDEYYEKNNLPKDNNVRLTFYTYNAFKLN